MRHWSIHPGASPVERFAAAELSRYLELITGRTAATDGADTRFLITTGPMDGLTHSDSYRIDSQEGTVEIRGATPRAALYGVYALLEHLGVRWYFPGAEGEVLPELDADSITLNDIRISGSPAVTKRGVVIEPGNSALEDWIDFAAKTRLSTVAVHGTAEIDRARSLAATRGIDIEVETHLLDAGLCSGDGEKLAGYRDQLDTALAGLPADMGDYFLWQQDNDNVRCTCHRDAGLTLTDTTLGVFNDLVGHLRARQPGARLAFLVYLGTWEPPRSVAPAPGLFAEIAPIHRCMAHAVEDRTCPINPRDIAATLDRWEAVLPPEQSQVLDYWLDSSLFARGRFSANCGRLPHIGRTIRDDVVSYRARGVDAITTFVVLVDRDYLYRWTSPTIHQYPRLLWDPGIDLDAELREFAETWFGTCDALPILEALAFADTQGLEHGRPEEADRRLLAARPQASHLCADAEEPYHSRLRRVDAELRHRIGWDDVIRDTHPKTY